MPSPIPADDQPDGRREGPPGAWPGDQQPEPTSGAPMPGGRSPGRRDFGSGWQAFIVALALVLVLALLIEYVG